MDDGADTLAVVLQLVLTFSGPAAPIGGCWPRLFLGLSNRSMSKGSNFSRSAGLTPNLADLAIKNNLKTANHVQNAPAGLYSPSSFIYSLLSTAQLSRAARA